MSKMHALHRLTTPLATLGSTALAALMTTLITPGAAAQQANVPPTPGLPDQPVWVGFLFMFLLAVVVLGISLMPSKRSHQD